MNKQPLRAEFRARIEHFLTDVGRPPNHLDNHCSVSYVRPGRFRVTLELAKEYDLPIRAPFGDDLEDLRALSDPRVRERLNQPDISLVSFAALQGNDWTR